jgi:hypothetical protein
MDITRKRFLTSLAGSTMAVLLSGCGGGGGGSPPPPAAATPPAPTPPAPAPAPTPPAPTPPAPTPPAPAPAPAATCGSSGSAILGNHGHQLVVPAADRDATTSMTYNIQGSADHNHTVTLTPAQLASLKTAGTIVVVESSINSSHAHEVHVSCV